MATDSGDDLGLSPELTADSATLQRVGAAVPVVSSRNADADVHATVLRSYGRAPMLRAPNTRRH